ncbi:MAG: hypothetical protein GYB53_17860 [Rhodobacteraceae bacterium]|nr:hypothetical protein [Paracoccaceae bacterium]MBR9821932.1 hypothetical protein [Paracoccaceae bacterium]
MIAFMGERPADVLLLEGRSFMRGRLAEIYQVPRGAALPVPSRMAVDETPAEDKETEE